MVLHPGAPEGSTGSGSGFKGSLKTGLRYFCGFSWAVTSTGLSRFMVRVCIIWRKHPKAHPKVVLEKLGIESATPCLQGIVLIHYILFVAFLGRSQFRQVGLRFVCWLYDGNTQRLTECGFMEKLRIKHLLGKTTFCGFPGYEPVLPGWFKICVLVFWRKHPKASHTWFYGEAGELNLRPLVYKAKLFVAFLGISQFRLVGLRFVCWFYDRKTQRLT